jgi:hypothetical protein
MAGHCWTYIPCVLDAAEHHAGLAGWVGAIGAIIAIFATWAIARSEYLRNRRAAAARRSAEIDTIIRVVSGFETEVLQEYVRLARAGSPEAYRYALSGTCIRIFLA